MRIGMLSWESLYSVKVGGIAPHVTELSEALAKLGHEVHIFTRRGDFDAYNKIDDVHYQRVSVNETKDLIDQMDNMCNLIYDRFNVVQKIFGKFDIIHCHDWHPVLAMIRINADHGVPSVFTVHSTEWGRCGNNWGYRRISHREWLGGYESSRIIVTSHQMKKELMQIYSIPEEKICIIPNGIVSGKLRNPLNPASVKRKYKIKANLPVILFCGRLNYQKGPDLLINAVPLILKKNKDARFVFAGEGEMGSVCKEIAHRLNVSDACRFLGYVSNQSKEDLMNACNILCVPSRNEPFGIIVLEAWDARKPVVATEAVSIINNFEDGLLAYIQPESIAWCINRLLSNPGEMRRIAENGRNRIEKEFVWEKIAEKTESLYNEI